MCCLPVVCLSLSQTFLGFSQVLHELTPMFSEWAGVELEPTSVYGVRIYRNGSTLRDHLDVLETHVISGILHVASDLDSPYPIQIEDGFGKLASADLKPGGEK